MTSAPLSASPFSSLFTSSSLLRPFGACPAPLSLFIHPLRGSSSPVTLNPTCKSAPPKPAFSPSDLLRWQCSAVHSTSPPQCLTGLHRAWVRLPSHRTPFSHHLSHGTTSHSSAQAQIPGILALALCLILHVKFILRASQFSHQSTSGILFLFHILHDLTNSGYHHVS